jgi:hypothetical protein
MIHAWLRQRRHLIKGLIVLTLIADGMDSLLRKGVLKTPHDWQAMFEAAQSAGLWFFTAWSVHRWPHKAGFRFGLLILCTMTFFVGVLRPLIFWGIQHHPEKSHGLSVILEDWSGLGFWLRITGQCLIGLAALSLRWLYPKDSTQKPATPAGAAYQT